MRPKTLRARLISISLVLAGLLFSPACSINQVGLGAQVDVTPPKLAISGPAADGSYAKGTVVLSGTFNEDVSLKSLAVVYSTPAGDKQKSVPIKDFAAKQAVSWTVALTSGPGGDLSDGANTLTVVATDNSDKVMTQTRLVYVDNAPPTVLIQSPSAYKTASAGLLPLYSDYLDIKGEVYDQSPVRSVKVSLLRSDATPLTAPRTADGTNTFSTRFLLKTAETGASGPLLGQSDDNATFLYTVTATDAAGNTNTWTFHRQDVYSTLASGVIFPTVDEIGRLDAAGTGTSDSGITFAALSGVRTPVGSPAYNFQYQHELIPRISFVNVSAESSSNILGVGAIISATIQPPPSAGSTILPNTVIATVYSQSDLVHPLATYTGDQGSGGNQTLTSLGDSVSYSLALKIGTTPLAPGPYVLHLSAQAQGSAVTSKDVSFFIDSGAPYLDKSDTTSTAAFVNTPIQLKGRATSDVGVAKIEVFQQFNGGTATLADTISLGGATNTTWASKALPAAGSPDGVYDYTITLTTTSGKTTNVYHNLTWDTDKPSVAVNSVTPLVGTNTVNGTVTFSGSATDPNGLKEVRWAVGAAEPADWSSATLLAVPPYQGTIDTTGLPDNSDQTLFLRAVDKAGNVQSASKVLRVNQSSDDPAVSLLNADGTVTGTTVAAAKANLFQNGGKILATAADDDGIDAATIEVRFDGGSWTPVTKKGVSGLAVSFEQDLSALADGVHSAEFRASDTGGKLAVSPMFRFVVDTTNPTLTVTGAASRDTKTAFSLTGTATDGVAVDAVAVTQSKDGGTAVNLGSATLGGTETSRTWTFGGATSLPRDPGTPGNALLADGTYVYTVLATDAAGKLSPLSTVTVRVDRTAPETLTLADPAAGQTGANSLTSKTNVFRGTAGDTGVGVATLWYKIDTSATAAAGTAGYTAVPAANGNWSFTDSNRAEGAWYLHIKAEDSAGNVTADAAALSRAFDIDVAAPVLAETTVGPALAERAAGFDLSGTWTETNGVASLTVTQRKDAGAAVVLSSGFSTGAAWSLTGLPRNPSSQASTLLADGTYEYTFTITDAAGKTGTLVRTVKLDRTAPVLTVTAPSAASWSTSTSVTVTGVTTDGLGTGTTLVEASTDGTTYSAVSGTASSWNLPLTGLPQGQKTVWFRASDAVGNVSTPQTLTFGVDTSAPSLPTETTSPGLTLSRLVFDLGGALADTNALASVRVTQNKDAAGAVELINTVTSGTSAAWSAVGLPRNPASPAATLLADGSYEYVVTVTDVAGKTAVLTRTVVVDTSAPTAVIDNPGVYLSGNAASLFGSAGDGSGSGVDLVQYSTVSASGPWTTATGKANWLVNLDLDTDGAGADTGLAEGTYTLWVQSLDKAGNPSAVASRVFLVDQAPPTLGLFKVDGADFLSDTIYENAALALTGTANDSYGIQAVTVSQTKSGGTTDTLPVTLGGGTTSRTWSATATLGQGEGDYTLAVTLTDLAGRQTTVQKTVVKDSQSPSAPVVTSPSAGTWLSGSNFSFTGTAADVGSAGLATVYYGVGARGLTPPASLADAFWTAAAGTATWNATASLTGEGPRSLYLKSIDKAGNVSVLQTLDYGIDQGSPNLTFDQPSGTFVNSTFALSGTASDTNAVASVAVFEKKPGDITYQTLVANAYSAGTWSASRVMGMGDGLPDGVYQYQVVVTDAAGKTTVLNKSVTRDLAAPTVGLNAPLPTVQVLGVYQGNGVLSLSGTAADLNGLDNLEIKVGAGAWTVLGTAPFTSFSTTLDTTLQTDGQDLSVAVRATDKAGNLGTSAWTIHVDQTTDRPTVAITSPSAGENVQSATISLTATINDDDAVNPAGAEYRLSYNGGTTWSAWTSVPSANLSGSATAKTLSLSINDPSNGTKLIQVRAADTGGVTGTSGSVSFSQDTGAPVLSGLLPAEGSVTAAASVVLSGTATDANAVTSVTYRVLRDGTEVQAVTAAALGGDSDPGTGVIRTFTSGSIATASSGNYQIQLESSDGGNTRQETINFTVDRTVPTVSFSAPAALSVQNNKIQITGVAGDNRLLSGVALEIFKGGNKVADVPGPVTGTANWSSVLDTSAYSNATYATFVSGTAWDLTVRAVATDSVGNVGTADLTFRIDQSTDSPSVSVTTARSPAFIGDFTVSGSAADDDGIASIEVSANGSTWTPLTAAGGGWTKNSSWNTVLAAGDGTKTLYLRVTDTSTPAVVTTTPAFTFQVDTETPDAGFTAPAAAAKLIGTELVFSGTFADENGVTAVKLKADSADFSSGAVTASFTPSVSGTWNYTFAAGDLAEGVRTIYLQVTDASGRSSTAARAVTVDKTAPVVTVSEPSSGSSAFGLVRLRGSAVDGTTGVKSIKIGLGKTINTGDWDNALNTWYPATGTVSWEYVISNINSYAGTTYATDLGDTNGNGVVDAGETWQNIWRMYLYIRSEDLAGATKGNTAVVSTYTLEIDPLKDRPEITVLQPVDAVSTVGGFLRIVGSSYDTNFIAKNQIAFDTDNNGVFNGAGDTWPGKTAGDIDQTDASTTAWYAMAGTTSWSQVINNAGEFNPTGGATTKTIRFKVRAVDSKIANGGTPSLAGLESVYTVTFSNQVPQYSAVSLATGDTIGGTVTLTGYVKVPAAVGMASITFNHEGPRISSSELIGGPAGMRAVLLTSGDGAYEAGYDKYAVEATVNTADADLFANNAGSMTVSLRSYDKSAFQSFQTISLSVDNKAPTAPSFTNLTEIAGTSALVQGTVADTGVVSGIKRVVFFLQRGSLVYRLKGGSGSLTNAGGEVLSLSNPAYDDYRIVIDKTTEGGSDAGAGGDGDGFNESLSSSFGTYTWNAAFNSTLVADGSYDAKIAAYDVGGNSTTLSQGTFVANNRPAILGVVLATDLNGDGDVVDAGESSATISANYAATGYTGRNGKLGLTVNATGGNGTKRYSVFHAGVERNATLTNNVLVIDTSGISDSTVANDKVFVIKVYDSTTTDDADATNELSATVSVGVTIDNVDDVIPTVAIAPFGQKYSTSDDDAAKSLGAVSLYTDNLKMSGTTPQGHVEYAADSLYNGTDADVSGEVIFKGKVADNQRISRITATIPGFDGGSGVGTEFNLYTFAGGALSGTGWTFAVDGTNYLTEAKGNVLNWNLTWNSALISTVAATNVTMTVKVYDARTPTANTASSALTFDVVPYVSKVTTLLSNLNTGNPSVYNRTALGKYPVNTTETVKLTGFNLTTSAGAPAVTITGISSGITATSGVVSVPMTSASTGTLPLTVNGVSLINNVNSNALTYNQAPNGVNNNLLTDDVVLDVWQFNSQAARPISGMVADPVMKINPVSGKVGLAFTNGPLYFSMGGTVSGTEYSYNYWQASFDFLTSIAFAYDSAGHTYGTAAGGDINSGSADKFGFMTDRWGVSGLDQNGSYGGTNANRMESIGLSIAGVNEFDKYRIKSPNFATSRIASGATSTNVYLAYYDNMQSEIAFRYGNLADSQTTKANFSNFRDTDTTGAPPTYSNTYKSIVAGSTTGRNAGEYVSIAVIPGATVSTDVVVMVWYDSTNQCLWYSYNTTPTTNRGGTATAAGWSTPKQIFTSAGEYCQVAVDAGGGVHIAAYDGANASLVYAHLNSYSDASPTTSVVDSFGIVGTNITLDVASNGSKYIPHIGYYAQSSVRPKYASLVDTGATYPDGAVGDLYTGAWEVTLLPTSSSVPQDRINVGVWKTTAGVLKASVTGTSATVKTGSGYTATNNGQVYGNGTSNGLLAYQIKVSTNGYIETAQKK